MVRQILSKKKLFFFLKYFFVVLLLATAIGKLLDNRGFAAVILTYQLLPGWVTLPLGLVVSLFELFLALAIIFNRKLLICAWLVIIMHLGYLSLAIITLWRGIALENCGCFGVFLSRPMTLQTAFEDAVLLILSFLFLLVFKNQRS